MSSRSNPRGFRPAPPGARAATGPQSAAPGVGRCAVWVVIVAAALPVGALLVLRALDVPLGQPGRFTYLYSELASLRQRSLPAGLILAAAAATGIWLLAGAACRARIAGGALATLAVGGLAAWAYLAPPAHLSQHVFNFQSPSHDGAFVHEARGVRAVSAYLAAFPQRAGSPPAAMRGTRVISNPPGATLLALAAGALLDRVPPLRGVAVASFDERGLDPEFVASAAHGLAFAWLLLFLWAASAAVLYLAAREVLPSHVAAAAALAAVCSAPTLLFSPGKDPAQLFSTGLVLWLWLRGLRHSSPLWALLAGVTLVPAVLMSLVHLWIAAILVVATLVPAVRPAAELRRRMVRLVIPAATGAALGAAALYVACGLDLPATVRAVAAAQAAVTRAAPDAMPFTWQLLGIPLFVLFCGPAVWCAGMAVVRPCDTAGRAAGAAADGLSGGGLVAASCVVMLATIGFTNAETPRLWIPFVPLILLGAALRVQSGLAAPAARGLLAVLVFAQVASAVVQWSLMDMREAEMRLIQRTPTDEPRLFD